MLCVQALAFIVLFGQVGADCLSAMSCMEDVSLAIQQFDLSTSESRNDLCRGLPNLLMELDACRSMLEQSPPCTDQDSIQSMMESLAGTMGDMYTFAECDSVCDYAGRHQVAEGCISPLLQAVEQTNDTCSVLQGVVDCLEATVGGCPPLEQAFQNWTQMAELYIYQFNCKLTPRDGPGICEVAMLGWAECLRDKGHVDPGAVGEALNELLQSNSTEQCEQFGDLDYGALEQCHGAENVSLCLNGANPLVPLQQICTSECAQLAARMQAIDDCWFHSYLPEMHVMEASSGLLNETQCGQLRELSGCMDAAIGQCVYLRANFNSSEVPDHVTRCGPVITTTPTEPPSTISFAPGMDGNQLENLLLAMVAVCLVITG